MCFLQYQYAVTAMLTCELGTLMFSQSKTTSNRSAIQKKMGAPLANGSGVEGTKNQLPLKSKFDPVNYF